MRERIILSAELRKEDTVIEIGPGKGALTQLIAPYVKQFIAIEADRDLIPVLKPLTEQYPCLNVIEADFLKWEFEGLTSPVKVIGNIPYNISTPIIERLIENRSNISTAWLTVQGLHSFSISPRRPFRIDIRFLRRRRSTSICFSPIPFCPIPPRWRSKWVQ